MNDKTGIILVHAGYLTKEVADIIGLSDIIRVRNDSTLSHSLLDKLSIYITDNKSKI